MKRPPPLGVRIGLLLALTIALVAILAPWVSPHAPQAFDISPRLQGPSPMHPFGYDEEGRDLLSLVIWGARVSLSVGLATVALSVVIGSFMGLSAGYFGGKWDHLFIFVTDVILAFPSVLLVIALAAFYRNGGMGTIVLFLSSVGWVGYARLVRGQVLSLKNREFVQSAVILGAPVGRIWLRHLLPNLAAPLLVQATFGMAGAILAEATLSFLGLGFSYDVPSWGRLLDQGVQYLLIAPHLSIFPGMAIALLILAFNLLGDGLRDYLGDL